MTVAELVVSIFFKSNDPQALPHLKTGLQGAKQDADRLATAIVLVNGGLSEMARAGNRAMAAISSGLIPRLSGASQQTIRLGNSHGVFGTWLVPSVAGGGASGIGAGGGPAGEGIGGPLGPVLPNLKLRPEAPDLKSTLKATTMFTVAIDALNLAMTKLVVSGGNAALALSRFRINTGGSTQDLQRLQGAFATQGISGDETQNAFQAIKDAQAQVKLGQGNPSVLGILGIDVNENDMNVIVAQMQKVMKTLDPNIARQFAQQLGFSANMLAAIQNADLNDTGLILSEDDIKRLKEFNETWNRLGRDLIQFKNQIAIILGPAFEDIAKMLEYVVKKGEGFVQWLKESPAAASAVKGLVVAMLLLGAALPVVVAGLAALAGIALAPEIAMWTGLFLALGAAVDFVVEGIGEMADTLRSVPNWINNLLGGIPQNIGNLIEGLPKDYVGAQLKHPNQVHQTNHISVSIDGSKSPQATVQEFDRHLTRIMTGTMATTGPSIY